MHADQKPVTQPVVGLGVSGGAAAAAVLLAIGDLSRARSQLLDVVGPTAVSLQQLGAYIVDQENGVRGYMLSGSDAFLQPYESGLERQALARATVAAIEDPVVTNALTALDKTLCVQH